MKPQPCLKIENLGVSYGHIRAVGGVSLEVGRGEMIALIGANGAGKSTVLRAVSGLAGYSGQILFEGRSLRGLPPHDVALSGIAHVPEGRGVFGALTVRENLELAFFLRRSAREVREGLDRVFEIFPRLCERLAQPAGMLSGGEQQMLALGRALLSGCRLMLLDEPSMGLAPLLVREIFQVLSRINALGTAVLLVEQNARMALKFCSRAYVLETGRVLLEGKSAELENDPRVREAYLGG